MSGPQINTGSGFLGVGGVFMGRTVGGASDRPIIVNDATTPFTPIVTPRELGAFDEFRGGIEAKGGMRVADSVFVVVRFLWLSEFSGRRELFNDGVLALPFLNDISTNFDGADSASITQTSNFHTLSVGPRYRVNRWLIVGGGFRYAYMTDNIFITMVDSPPEVGTYDLRVRNLLLGGELNATLKLPITDRIGLMIHGAAAFLHNSTRVSNSVSDPDDQRAFRNAVARRSGFSFLGELGVTGTYSVEHWLKIYAGYRVLWLTGVGTAAHNLDFNSTATGITQTINAENGANVIYHGGVVGVKVVF